MAVDFRLYSHLRHTFSSRIEWQIATETQSDILFERDVSLSEGYRIFVSRYFAFRSFRSPFQIRYTSLRSRLKLCLSLSLSIFTFSEATIHLVFTAASVLNGQDMYPAYHEILAKHNGANVAKALWPNCVVRAAICFASVWQY